MPLPPDGDFDYNSASKPASEMTRREHMALEIAKAFLSNPSVTSATSRYVVMETAVKHADQLIHDLDAE